MVGTARLHHDDGKNGRASGQRLAVRHAWPDGTDYKNKITFDEVVKPERLIYRHGGGEDDVEPVIFHVTATFIERGSDKTELTLRMVFPSAAERDRVVDKYGAIEGGKLWSASGSTWT